MRSKEQAAIRRFETPGLPFDAYEVAEVFFPHEDVDVSVPLGEILKTQDKSLLGYILLGSDTSISIYDSRNVPGGKLWTDQEAFLRSDRAVPVHAVVLFVLRRAR